jgi:hypothetical protein
MTHVTPCQTQHNHPANREKIGAAVHAAVKTVTKTKITATPASTLLVMNEDAPRSFARQTPAPHALTNR